MTIVIISDLELLLDTSKASGSSCLDLGLHMLKDLSFLGISSETDLLLWGLWLWSSKDIVVLLCSWLSSLV